MTSGLLSHPVSVPSSAPLEKEIRSICKVSKQEGATVGIDNFSVVGGFPG